MFTESAVADFTDKQGQYLAFIHLYTKLNRRPPAVADIADYFRVSGPSAQNMVKTLVKKGLVDKQPRTPRSLRVLVPTEDIPNLRCEVAPVQLSVSDWRAVVFEMC